mgnify:CR=1 FL=1
MVKESFQGDPKGVAEKVTELTNTIRDMYGKHYDDLSPKNQTLWNELFRFANIEKDQSAEQREVLTESLTSFLKFLESEYGSKS